MFSPYLDGVADRARRCSRCRRHLLDCAACDGEYRELRRTQQLLVGVGRAEGSGGPGIEAAAGDFARGGAAKRAPFEGLRVRLENALNAFMVPATAGFLSALIIFGIAMVYFVTPSSLQASNDVPLVMVNTAPELQQSAFGMTMDSIDADSLVIEA